MIRSQGRGTPRWVVHCPSLWVDHQLGTRSHPTIPHTHPAFGPRLEHRDHFARDGLMAYKCACCPECMALRCGTSPSSGSDGKTMVCRDTARENRQREGQRQSGKCLCTYTILRCVLGFCHQAVTHSLPRPPGREVGHEAALAEVHRAGGGAFGNDSRGVAASGGQRGGWLSGWRAGRDFAPPPRSGRRSMGVRQNTPIKPSPTPSHPPPEGVLPRC